MMQRSGRESAIKVVCEDCDSQLRRAAAGITPAETGRPVVHDIAPQRQRGHPMAGIAHEHGRTVAIVKAVMGFVSAWKHHRESLGKGVDP
ncbi:MAG: hypothetical protein JOZ62_19155 [Acidobacteriaceae bacterium]|nr:hypothetical protein [Acidobacteriaceae bacterium]